MTLIIEDGSIVPNSNSVVTDEEFVAYAGLRSLTVPAAAFDRAVLLILAMDYLKSVEDRMKGNRTDSTQSLPEPRMNVSVFGSIIGSNTIPQQFKDAQMEAGIAANTSTLLVNKAIQNVKSKKLSSLEIEYFEGGSWSTVRLDRVNAVLSPLLTAGGFGRTVRIL